MYTGDINYHDVTSEMFWSLKLDDILVNGKSLGLCDIGVECLITPDSGTSYLTLPTWAYYLAGSDFIFENECNDVTKFGTLTYVIDGINYDLPPEHWWMAVDQLNTNKSFCVSKL